jgi:hypothetical protein
MFFARVALCIGVSGALAFGACASGEDEDKGATGGGSGDASTSGGAAGSSGSGATAAGGGASGGAGTSGGGTAGAGDGGTCVDDVDCDGATPMCKVSTGVCVQCLPEQDNCAFGLYCDDGNTCVSGCNDDMGCPSGQNCDVSTHLCVDCLTDPDCAIGTVCANNSCVPGCSAIQPCATGQACCGTTCKETLFDIQNCGSCGNACPDLPNAAEVCYNGICGQGACDPGFVDCDSLVPGCETAGTVCTCTPGATQPCYFGPPGTAGVGICKSGTQTCGAGGWESCVGQVVPAIAEICGNGLDDNCDGQVDEDADLDGDGYGACGGDCCDQVGPNCGNPALVNPGAFEVPGNGVDDDCDGIVDNPVPLCDSGLASNSSNALDYAKAIDLCQFTVENPPTLQQKKWGVINAQLVLANGSGAPNANSRSIRNGFGTAIVPKKGQNLAVLSTGHAADKNDTNPSHKAYQDGENMNTSSPFPADWYQANGNKLPGAGGCS